MAGNDVNDVSAVGIVYFGGPNTTIRDNVITETNTSAFSGINVGDAIVPDNTGVVVQDNRLVAVGPRYFHTGLAAGLHAARSASGQLADGAKQLSDGIDQATDDSAAMR